MCLIVKKETKQTKLESDMIVWKVVNVIGNLATSLFWRHQQFMYEQSKTYSTTIEKSLEIQPMIFDDIVFKQFGKELADFVGRGCTVKLSYLLGNGVAEAYGRGFHFATTRGRLDFALKVESLRNASASIEQFVNFQQYMKYTAKR